MPRRRMTGARKRQIRMWQLAGTNARRYRGKRSTGKVSVQGNWLTTTGQPGGRSLNNKTIQRMLW